MATVSNTSPLSNLSRIGRLELLRKQFGTIVIPLAVWQELSLIPDKNAWASLVKAQEEGWLIKTAVLSKPLVKHLSASLDAGEAQAIALAVESKAEMILLDEHEARKAAMLLDLSVTGVIGVLIRAKKQGDLSVIRPELQNLRERAHFYLSEKLEIAVLTACGETPPQQSEREV